MKPWTSGPKELLQHAIEHTEKGSSFDNRIAFISIDNSIELIVKTYLGLPRRIRKSDGPPRKKLQEASQSFPDLLDLLEEYGSDRLEGIELGDIEWYHRLRNTLYHEGNGVTVDPEKVDSYLQIATILYNNLFAEELNKEAELEPKSVVGEIVLRRAQLEHNINALYQKNFPEEKNRKVPLRKAVFSLYEKGLISKELIEKISELSSIRNEAVHSPSKIDTLKVKKAAENLLEIVRKVAELMYVTI